MGAHVPQVSDLPLMVLIDLIILAINLVSFLTIFQLPVWVILFNY